MFKRIKNKRGFTLVELLICLAILGILMAAIAGFLVPTMNLYAKAQKTANAKNASELIMSYIEGSVYSTNSLKLQKRSASYTTVAAEEFVLATTTGKRDATTNGGDFLTHKGGDADTGVPVYTKGITGGLEFYITYAEAVGPVGATDGGPVLDVSIEVYEAGKYGTKSVKLFSMKKSIYLMNMDVPEPPIAIVKSGTAPYTEIVFTKPVQPLVGP